MSDPAPSTLPRFGADHSQPFERPDPLERRSQPQPLASVTAYQMTFTGSAAEYFRIWIVNLALSVVTLGFYIPWARVRTRQYFYGHTWLDGHNFEYTADPWALLRGYLVVGAFSLTYSLSTQFSYKGSGWVMGVVAALGALLFPWLVRQSMRFLARSTVHRGLNFKFTGSVGGAYFAYGLTNVLAVLSAGLAWPWAWATQRRYQVEGISYGSAKGHFRGDTGSFYVIALVTTGITIGGAVALAIVAAVVLGVPGVTLPPLSKADSGFSHAAIVASIIGAYLSFLLLHALAGQYMRAAVMQYVLNNVELGGVVRLAANFSPWMFAWISLSNYAAQLVSLGLLTPWGAVRRTKYLISHLQVRAIASLDDFSAAQTDNAGAIGEAASELFDINLGF